MNKKYRVVFLGLIESSENFKEKMSRLGVSPTMVDQIISKMPVVLKGDMSLRDARQYADAIQYAGGRVNIQEHGVFEEPEHNERSVDIAPLENFIMCPQCGYKQLKDQACVKCGMVFVKSESN